MTNDELALAPLNDLKREVERVGKLIPNSKFYLFGSAVTHPKACPDFDVLAVADTHEEQMRIFDEMHDVCSTWPIDLLVMSPAEEAECDFVQAQSCHPLFPTSVVTSHIP
ncbi:nucleotidyltransferase domain-containing protein [Rhizobium sp. R693]|uniref:nucleotidyltransferase domain-containing protein n=1 Tax=Rhizobium sp. R693 TaxID=1764276 RepID=UPI000B52DD90|nr:nucleotidyltransferase domain-containing protein [Rhizobium sp. R693]OWV99548.1 hypothetical protein ATY79_17490 [Rhizobium sp. R693]